MDKVGRSIIHSGLVSAISFAPKDEANFASQHCAGVVNQDSKKHCWFLPPRIATDDECGSEVHDEDELDKQPQY